MTLDTPQPGEIDLETGATAAAETASETATETTETAAQETAAAETTEQATETTQAATETQEAPAPKHKGAVAELIALRRETQELETRLRSVAADPVLSRLTPEMRQAAAEGRLIIKPPQHDADAEKARLEQVANRLSLYKYGPNNELVPDLDKAREAAALIREVAHEAVAPLQQHVLSGSARDNYTKAVAHAEANGFDVETVKEVFGLLSPEALANPRMAESAWRQAVGLMVERGKPVGNGATARPPAKSKDTPAAVIVEPAGRRGSTQNAIQLNPKLARVYADHGLDPNKGFSTKLQGTVIPAGGIELE